MRRPTTADMERTLRDAYPEVESFPLLRTLAAAACELRIPQRELLRSLPGGRKALWIRRGKTYIPPDIFERFRAKAL